MSQGSAKSLLAPVFEDWTPTLSNITEGNGTVVARYAQVGDIVICYFSFQLGSTSAIGSSPAVSPPIAVASGYFNFGHNMGVAHFRDATSSNYVGYVRLEGDDDFRFQIATVSGTYPQEANISSTVPFTWTTDDVISFCSTYEAA